MADVDSAASVIAAVAEEDFLGAQPPVDLEERARRFAELVDVQLLWVLDDDDRIVGYAAAPESARGAAASRMS